MRTARDMIMEREVGDLLGRGVPIEPLAVERAYSSTFGSVAGQMSVSEVQDVLASGQARMTQLGNAYAAFAPAWVNQDHVAFIDWTADWTNLQGRWKAAVDKANSNAITPAKFNPTPSAMIPAQAEYDGLLKALRQCAPPDGCPVVKGDWDDLNARLDAAKGSATQYTLPQPKATDVDQSLFATTASVDPVAMVTGAQTFKWHVPAWPFGDPSAPKTTSAVKWLFIGVGVAVGGVLGGKIAGVLGAQAGFVGAVAGAALGAGAVEVTSLELAAVGKSAKASLQGAAKSLLSV